MSNNAKLENKLKELYKKDPEELVPVKLQAQQAIEMLENGEGEVVYHKIHKKITTENENLKEKLNNQLKKTEIQKYKEEINNHLKRIFTTIDHMEQYTYSYIDKVIEEQEGNLDNIRNEVVQMFIAEDELNQIKKINAELNEKYYTLEEKHNEVNELYKKLQEDYENIQTELSDKKDELIEVKEKYTDATNNVNQLVTIHKQEVINLNDRFNNEQKRRVDVEQDNYEIKLKQEGLLKNIEDEKERVKTVQQQLIDERTENTRQLEVLRKEKDDKIETLFKQINKLELQLSDMQVKFEDLEEESEKKDEKIDTLGTEKSKLELQVANLEKDQNDNDKKIKEQGLKNSELETEKSRLELQVADLEKVKNDNDETIKAQQQKIDELRSDKNELKVQRDALETEKEELQGYKEDLFELKVQMQALKKELESLKQEKNNAENKYNELFEDYKELANNKANNNLDNEVNNKVDDKVNKKK